MSPWRSEPEGAAPREPVDPWPTVSVIVPVYNAEAYLHDALASALAQTAPIAEVVVVDDGSTDRSPAVAAEVAAQDPRVRVLRQANGGPSVARNAGIAAATGEYLVFHDADDLMLEHRVAAQVGYLVTHPDVDAVVSSTQPFLEQGTSADSAMVRKEQHVVRNGRGLNLMTMAAPATTFASVGGFDPRYRIAEDTVWILKALEHDAVIAILPAVVTSRRLHDANLSHEVDAAERAFFQGLAEHIRARRAR